MELTSVAQCQAIVNYLDLHPLLTAKCSDYLDWRRVVELIACGEHLTPTGRAEIIRIKSNFNSKRITFNWSHLKTLHRTE